MAPNTWLDVHGHFFLPRHSEEEDQTLVEAFHKGDFMVKEAPAFDPESTIAYMDKAGVALQLLSYLPPILQKLRAANDFAASVIARYPKRFGQLIALPTDNPDACLEEIKRTTSSEAYPIHPDGFALATVYNGVDLGDKRLNPVWEELNTQRASIFVHPNAYAPGTHGRPSPVIEVAFDTARTIVEMIYQRVFSRFPNINFIFAHSGGALPVLAGRLTLLGTETWIQNPNNVTTQEIRKQLQSLWFDTAATAETGMEPAAKVAGIHKIVYGADCGVPCSTERTMEVNRGFVRAISEALSGDADTVGLNGWNLFPAARARAGSKAQNEPNV